MKEGKKIIFLFVFFIVFFNLIYSINGFGLSMSYNDKDRPLALNPGDSKEIDFVLLSSARESSKKIRLDIVDGTEIASLEKNEFELPNDGEEKGFIKIKIPETSYKKEYLIGILIKEIGSVENLGTVGFSFSSKTSFIVKVKEPEKSLSESGINLYVFLYLILIIIIIFLIVLIYIVLKRRKFFNENKKLKRNKLR